MSFDLQDDYAAVQSFAAKSIAEFASKDGLPSIAVFDVQGVHGQIHLYISTSLTIENYDQMLGKPVPYIADFDKWSDFYYSREQPSYLGKTCSPDDGDGAFNGVAAQMVAHAVRDAVNELSAEAKPEMVFVHAAFESGGTFSDKWSPTKG